MIESVLIVKSEDEIFGEMDGDGVLVVTDNLYFLCVGDFVADI